MKDSNLKLAQHEVDEALQTIQELEEVIDAENCPKNSIKEKFLILTKKVQEIEDILKNEGIL